MTIIPALALSSLLVACGDKGGDTGGDTGTSVEANIFMTDANNFSYVGDINVPSFTTASGTDIEVCWSKMTQDLQCHDIDPVEDIDNVGLVRFPHLSESEVEDALSANSLQQADISGYVEWNTNHSQTCINLSEFSFFGTAIDITVEYTEEGGTYMLMFAEGLEPGVGARNLVFLNPEASSDVTRVDVGSGCGLLDFSADIHSLTPSTVPADGPWVVDWSAITADGLGSEIALEDIDEVMLAFYEGKTATDLEAEFLDLELIADELYTIPLEGGSKADLAEASGSAGTFTGFKDGGTWIFALNCSTCYNPAPLFLTVLETQ